MTIGKRFRPALLLALFATAMTAPLIFAGKVFFFRDFGFYYYPVKRYFMDRILQGRFPLWAPEISCGTPVHAELVHGFLYPLNALLFLGAAPGWGLYFATHLFLGGLGARRLAMKFGAGADAALAAGIAFAGSGYLVSQMNHVPYATAAAWSPLIVSLVMDIPERRRSTLPLLALCFVMAALAGEPFTLLLTLLFIGVVILGGFAGPRIRAMATTGAAGMIAILIASPSLLPAWQQLGESVRSVSIPADADGFGSLHPIRFATLFAPEALGRHQHVMELPVPFGGGEIDITPPILLGIHLGALTVVALLLAPVRSSRSARWLLAVIAAAGLLSLGTHLGLADWLQENVPGLGMFRYPDKYWLVATLAAATLLGVSVSRLRPIPVIIVSILCAAVALVLGFLTKHTGAAMTGALAFALVAAAFRAPEAYRVRALTAVLALELLFVGLRHSPYTDPANLSPMHPEGIGAELEREHPIRIFDDYFYPVPAQVPAVTLLRLRNLQSLGGVPYGFSYTIGYDPVEPLARIARFFTMPSDLASSQRNEVWHRLLRIGATTHSVTNKPVREDRAVALPAHLQRENGIRVLQNRGWTRRTRLYGDTVRVPDAETGRRTIQDLQFDPFSTLVLEGEGGPENGGKPRGRARIVTDEDRLVRVEVESDRPAWLFLADAYARGWTATVNGAPAEIRVGMTAFRAVRVPEGKSEVEFRYAPSWIGIVPFTAGAGLLLLALSFWYRRRSSPPRPTDPGE